MGYRMLLAWFLPATLMGIISRGRLPRTIREWLWDIAEFRISPLLYFGPLITAAVNGLDSDMPLTRAIEDTIDVFKSDTISDAMKHSLRAIGVFKGLPISQLERTAYGLRDLESGETSDVRRLIYSEYQMREPKE